VARRRLGSFRAVDPTQCDSHRLAHGQRSRTDPIAGSTCAKRALMTLNAVLVQALNGLASASGLFFVAAGLSLIFGITRIINIAHGSLYMLGVYLAYTFATYIAGGLGFWGGIIAAAAIVALLGAVIEVVLLRHLYHAPELFQLLATFALVLVINDAVLWFWGPDDLLGPRAPGLSGAIVILGRHFPSYDLFLIAMGPIVLLALHVVLARSRFGRLVRAASQDREMVGALGVNQSLLFTSVFALGAFLAGLGGAMQVAREPANLLMDLTVVGDAFVVVVVGGMGSITGAYLAALLIAEIKALCIAIGGVDIGGLALNFSKLTLVAEFIVMAAVLIVRPYGLLGRPQGAVRGQAQVEDPMRPAAIPVKVLGVTALVLLALLPLLSRTSPYALVLATDVLIAILFASSLHFIMGPGGMHSFGHAAYFGLGAYGASLLVKFGAAPMLAALAFAPLVALAGALLFGWFAVRLSGVYLAMLTLAFAQIVWSIVFQWEELTGGSNGVVGIWPTAPFDKSSTYYWLVLALTVGGVLLLRRMLFSPFGYAMRAGRDSPLRAEAIGIDVKRVHWFGFAVAGAVCGVAGALFAFAKGSISPETIAVGRSIDGLVMVLLGGIQTLTGPIVGASAFTLLEDTIMRQAEYWRALLGGIILLLVLAFPGGIVGGLARWAARFSR
jgi:branched-chain amino acid transport system permease protein